MDTNWAGAVIKARPAPLPRAGSLLHGYSSGFDQQQHVVYIGVDNHVYELYNLNAWKFNDLTSLTGCSLAHPVSSLSSYVTSFNEQQHVDLVGVDGHLHEIYYDGGWKTSDLGGNVLTGTPLAGYETGFNQQQHVVCLDSNDRIVELLYDDVWNPPKDLTDDVNAKGADLPQPVRGSMIARQFCGYSTEFDQQQHIIFIGEKDGTGFPHIYELYYSDGAWNANDLTVAAGPKTPLPTLDGALAAYPTEFNNQHHVIFFGTDSRLHELYFADGAWKHSDLTSVFGATPPPSVLSALTGYATGFNQQQHVMFIGADGRIYEIAYADGAWRRGDVSTVYGKTAPPVAISGSALTGYATDYDEGHHVIYLGLDSVSKTNHIYELLYLNGSWQWNDLTALAVIPLTEAEGAWIVPSVSTPDQPQSSQGGWQSATWVGIGGQGTDDVLQAGTSQAVDDDGISTTYWAWYEWFAPKENGSPNYRDPQWIEKIPVKPTDQMYCKVEYIDNLTHGRVTLKNLTNGASFSKDLDPLREAAFNGNTAEWIMEAPQNDDGNQDTVPLFSPINFTACSASDDFGIVFDPKAAGTTVEISSGGTTFTSTAIPLGGEVSIVYVT